MNEIGGEGSDGVSGDVGIGGKIHGHAAGNGWLVGDGLEDGRERAHPLYNFVS